MGANFHILTNNPQVAEKYPTLSVSLSCGVEGIFLAARDEIHLGAVAINHPLSGSVKPNESPYKSLVLSLRRGPLDIDSLTVIESAIEVLRKMPVRNIDFHPRVLEDFQVIDLDLLNSAIVALPAQYHM
ncbi:MAG: GrdX family protein [Oscillospiraceae bacterium]|nr:GrdX family protein [Oscillospiraceae bacterium]